MYVLYGTYINICIGYICTQNFFSCDCHMNGQMTVTVLVGKLLYRWRQKKVSVFTNNLQLSYKYTSIYISIPI